MNHLIGHHPHPRMIALLILLGLTFLTACTNAIEPTPVPLSTQILPEPTSTLSPTPSSTLTNSPTYTPTLANTPSPILPTNTLDTGISQQCLPVQTSLSPEIIIEGKVVMYPDIAPAYILDVNSDKKTFLNEEDDGLQYLRISPDGKWLAGKKWNGQQEISELVVFDSDGQPVYEIKWDDSWRMISGWLDNENLWISKMRGDSPYVINDSLFLLNPFTGQQQEIMTDFQELENAYPGQGWSWFWGSATIFDSSLSRVVYPGFNRLFLWDVQNSQQLAVIIGTVSEQVTPIWSPDNEQFLVIGPPNLFDAPKPSEIDTNLQELFRISRDGVITKITFFADYFQEVDFGDYAWSPDGRYVAFSLDVEPSTYPDIYSTPVDRVLARFAILDIATLEIIDYCVPIHPLSHPVWSLNSHQIVFENDSREIYKNEVYLIDISQNLVIKIAEDAHPAGWLSSLP